MKSTTYNLLFRTIEKELKKAVDRKHIILHPNFQEAFFTTKIVNAIAKSGLKVTKPHNVQEEI